MSDARLVNSNADDTKNNSADSTYEDKKQAVSVMNLTEYDFLEMAYHGDKRFRDGRLIVPHPREGTYKNRRELSFFKNFIKPVINARMDPVFSDDIERETQDEDGQAYAPPLFTKFLEDCDNTGDSFGEFIDDAAREGNRQSLCFLVVDNFSDFSANVADNVRDRKLPYIYKQNRNTLKDYQLDRFGAIKWIRFFDHTEKQPDGKSVDYYRLWDSMQARLQRAEGQGDSLQYKDVEIVDHNLGVVPVYPMMFAPKRKKDSLDVDYEFYDLARCNWTIYNLDSSTMEAIRDQCFSLLCIQGPKQSDVVVGTKAICWVDEAVQNMPQFISPNPEVARLAGEYAASIKKELYEIAEQNGVTAIRKDGVSEQSGKAKEWDFQAHGFILKKMAGICRRAELWVAKIFMLYTGEKFNYIPHYKMDYAVVELDSVISVQEKVIDNNVSPKANALARKNIARVAFAHNNEDELKEIIDEIDAATYDEAKAEAEAGAVIPVTPEANAG